MRKCKCKIGVVILNYKAYLETLECVRSFKNQSYPDIEIIVVENGSENESQKILKLNLEKMSNVHIIVSKVNLGFAKGNNLGINYARKNLSCTDIIIINSDTVVQPSFVEEIISGKESEVAVISPTVINVDQNYQLPTVNTSSMPIEIMKTYKNIFITTFLNYPFINKFTNKGFKFINDNTEDNTPNVMYYYLQGCAYMLTSEFFKHYSQLYPNTFLYWEELNLLWYIYKAKMKTKFINTSPVLHKVAISTEMLIGKGERRKKKEKLVYESMKKSTGLYFTSYARIRKKFND